MANISDFLKGSTALTSRGQPGSNGFLKRDLFMRPGTFTWTARKSGKIKVQAIGAASGACEELPGNPGHFGEKELTVTAGQTLTIVVGAGGVGRHQANDAAGPAGGTTSISGTPVGGTPLTLPGAPGVAKHTTNPAFNTYGPATTPTGPWDRSFNGGIGSLNSMRKGAPASASPFGPGVHAGVTSLDGSGSAGMGWGGVSNGTSGASSHRPGVRDQTGAHALTARGSVSRSDAQNILPEIKDWWDLDSVDSGGGGFVYTNSSTALGCPVGPGAGGGIGQSGAEGAPSVLGGGSAYNCSYSAGNGSGGSGGNVNNVGRNGGDAMVLVFWDEM